MAKKPQSVRQFQKRTQASAPASPATKANGRASSRPTRKAHSSQESAPSKSQSAAADHEDAKRPETTPASDKPKRGPGNFAKRAVDTAKEAGETVERPKCGTAVYAGEDSGEPIGYCMLKAGHDGPHVSEIEDSFLDEENEQREQRAQGTLPGMPEQTESAPPAKVAGNKVVAQFVRVVPEQDEGDRFLRFDFAVELSPEVADVLPPLFQDAFHTLHNDAGITRLDLGTEEAMDFHVSLTPNEDTAPCLLDGLVPQKIRVQTVLETGSTKARQVIRLSFAVIAEQTDDFGLFALHYHGDPVWLRIAEVNARLPLARAAKA